MTDAHKATALKLVSDSSSAESGSESESDSSSSDDDPKAKQVKARLTHSLPDLKERLKRDGRDYNHLLGDEYRHYWGKYRQWRQGGASGARGELSGIGDLERAFSVDGSPFSATHSDGSQGQSGTLLGTPEKFSFFYTIAYWVAIWSTAGAMVLTFCDVAPLFYTEERRLPAVMMHRITFIGDFAFTLGSYLNYVEMINMPRVVGGRLNLFCRPSGMKTTVGTVSKVGILAYLWGMLIWDIAAIADCMPEELEGNMLLIFVKIPNTLGAVCFFIGGVCEVLHNRDKTPYDKQWWAAAANFTGDCGFLLGVIFGFFESTKKYVQLCFAIGISMFVVGGIMFIVLWRGNDFGFTLLSQLNAVAESGGEVTLRGTGEGMVSVKKKLSPAAELERQETEDLEEELKKSRLGSRDVVFLVIYCWLGSVAAMGVVVSVYHAEGQWRHFTDVADCWLWMIITMLVLVVHSAIASVPNMQPYRLAMLSTRVLMFVAAIVQTANFWMWLVPLSEPNDENEMFALPDYTKLAHR